MIVWVWFFGSSDGFDNRLNVLNYLDDYESAVNLHGVKRSNLLVRFVVSWIIFEIVSKLFSNV